MKKEDGFIYPITFCLLLFFCMFLLLHVGLFRQEKMMIIESEKIYLQEYYFLSMLKTVEELAAEGSLKGKGEMAFREGKAEYKVEPISSTVDSLSFTLRMNTGEVLYAIAHYDKSKKVMIKWYEKN
ncbi:competence type IV pilus minor pilin ComGG [Bacillus massilinigeriensis]|uniref:competence type IV pilus minor pilin ComGG n=1 Tax=Bacillus mediterraneensis TaxID=1805474 RepID=UPI0008F8ED54|nr:competence type IV pilus minor pilin ComGG [Bacillus mediterraneensis]